MGMRYRLVSVLIWVLPALGFVAESGMAQESQDVSVRYRSQDTVYLDNGSRAGLAEGDRLEVTRGGQRIGEIEVTFVAEHSASCKIIEETQQIQPDDRVRPSTAESSSSPPPVAAQEAVETPEIQSADPVATPQSSVYSSPRPVQRSRRTRVSGVLELGWDSFKDDSEAGLDFEQLSARFNLRMRDIAGMPLHLRVRLRAQDNKRARPFSTGAPKSEKRNRFYEAALVYDPERGRFKAQVGRIAVSPFIAVGYLDGFIGQVRLIPAIDIGALFGSQPVIQDDGFKSIGQKYGAYTRFSALRQAGGHPNLEVFVAGIREEGEQDVSREYVSLETRYTPGGRWSLYQRAELDLNNGWREEAAGTKTQLSNLALTLDTRISQSSRFSISYDRWERYFTDESQSITEELFDNLLRQGLRARYSYSRSRGMGFSVYAGYRDRQGEDENTASFGGAIRHSNIANWGLMIGGDLLGYSNPMTEGFVARLQTSKRFHGGHELALQIGGRMYSSKLFEDMEDRNDQWLRLSGWVELPFDFFARAEFEYSNGDDIQGQRILISAGYRL